MIRAQHARRRSLSRAIAHGRIRIWVDTPPSSLSNYGRGRQPTLWGIWAMKQAFAILGMVFIFVSGAAAQEHPVIERLLTTTYFTLAPTSDAAYWTMPLAVAPVTLASFWGAPS